jgi:hypothetical protein
MLASGRGLVACRSAEGDGEDVGAGRAMQAALSLQRATEEGVVEATTGHCTEREREFPPRRFDKARARARAQVELGTG